MTQLRNIALVASILILWQGFPFSTVGLPQYLGQQVAAAIILLGVMGWVLLALRGIATIGLWETSIIAFFAYCIIVSLIYSTFLSPQPLTEWVPALYAIVPVLLIFPLRFMRVKLDEVFAAIILVAVIGAVLQDFDQFYNLGFLDQYVRGSYLGSTRRLELFRTEMAFALVISFARLLNAKKPRQRLSCLAVLLLVGYALFAVAEARLPMSAVLIGCTLYLLVMYRDSKKPLVVSFAVILAVVILPLMLGKYIHYLNTIGDIRVNDTGIAFRALEWTHFNAAFEKTHGIGFGVMSAGAGKNNIISFANNYAGYLYGTGSYGAGLVDTGLWAAMFQFGYLGLAVVLGMTAIVIRKLWKAGRASNAYLYRTECGAIAGVVIGLSISPLPTNFFSVGAYAPYGGLLWFMASAAFFQSKKEESINKIIPKTMSIPKSR
ncbi:MAG: hypothetical protein P4L50_23435 [Anaerolineaceae bacterium]|nr:hypothetical protein [Anaerolineaceae bacterium]